jgi:hypothetical protein
VKTLTIITTPIVCQPIKTKPIVCVVKTTTTTCGLVTKPVICQVLTTPTVCLIQTRPACPPITVACPPQSIACVPGGPGGPIGPGPIQGAGGLASSYGEPGSDPVEEAFWLGYYTALDAASDAEAERGET